MHYRNPISLGSYNFTIYNLEGIQSDRDNKTIFTDPGWKFSVKYLVPFAGLGRCPYTWEFAKSSCYSHVRNWNLCAKEILNCFSKIKIKFGNLQEKVLNSVDSVDFSVISNIWQRFYQKSSQFSLRSLEFLTFLSSFFCQKTANLRQNLAMLQVSAR